VAITAMTDQEVSGTGVAARHSNAIGKINEIAAALDVVAGGAIADPGNGGAIPVTVGGVCAMTSAGAETRTLAIPTTIGQRLTLICDTYVGDIVITAAGGVNQAGNTSLTFGVAADFLELVAATVAGALVWRVVENDGVVLA